MLLFCASARALEPDEIALVINEKATGSRVLAEFYAQQRQIPAGRIIPLSIPQPDPSSPREEIPFDDYETQVAQPIRDFLTANGLKDRVKCLVTFWGVPLRAAARTATPAERDELVFIKKTVDELRPRIKEEAHELEALAKELNPKFAPTTAPAQINEPQILVYHINEAVVSAVTALAKMPADAKRAALFDRLMKQIVALGGKSAATLRLASLPYSPLATQPVTPDQILEARQQLLLTRQRLGPLDVHTAIARTAQREITRDNLGTLSELYVLDLQYELLVTDQTESAIDSELSAIWWGLYSRFRWRFNPLYCHYEGPPAPLPTLMVMRIDAPTLPAARNLITNSMEVERTGLAGKVVIDARGKPPIESFGVYDQTLRNLAELIREHTKLDVVLDNREPLLPAHSVSGVALYCGWYSLRHYVPSCEFNRGAVGFHIASFELLSLHAPNEGGWVAGLLNDGVVGTLGPVSEPYLQSFPKADEFFPLLLTGKLTLAEVYWRTTPMVSWMQACIGDPLYRPYAAHPALATEDLPLKLRGSLAPKSDTRPVP